jgi:hypothetical protein
MFLLCDHTNTNVQQTAKPSDVGFGAAAPTRPCNVANSTFTGLVAPARCHKAKVITLTVDRWSTLQAAQYLNDTYTLPAAR